jgi:hypothetical protein
MYYQAAVDFLYTHLHLVQSHVVDFHTHHHISLIPPDWVHALVKLGDDELFRLPTIVNISPSLPPPPFPPLPIPSSPIPIPSPSHSIHFPFPFLFLFPLFSPPRPLLIVNQDPKNSTTLPPTLQAFLSIAQSFAFMRSSEPIRTLSQDPAVVAHNDTAATSSDAEAARDGTQSKGDVNFDQQLTSGMTPKKVYEVIYRDCG